MPAGSMLSTLTSSNSISSGGKSPDRHWTISGLKTRFSFKKTNSFNVPLRSTEDDSAAYRRRDRSIISSTFYDREITKTVSEPADFVPLQLRDKSMNELLLLLRPVSV